MDRLQSVCVSLARRRRSAKRLVLAKDEGRGLWRLPQQTENAVAGYPLNVHSGRKASWTLLQHAPYVSLPVQNGDNLEGSRIGPVNNGVVGITGKRPETQRAGCEVGARMATHGSVRNKGASVIDRLFYAVGGLLTVLRNVGPDVKISTLASGVRA
jgi:hypothetical protein